MKVFSRSTLVLALVAASSAASCTSSLTRDATRLAGLPPLPYRIAVVGGAFLPAAEREVEGRPPREEGQGAQAIWTRTFVEGVEEPIPFKSILDLLERGRAASRTLAFAQLDRAEREALARGDSAAVERARALAEAADADLLLVVEGVREGPVQYVGVTGQWPITTAAWLLAGIGLFVPDHRYLSRAKLRASIVDVHSGRRLLSAWSFSTTPIELSLYGRGDFLGIASSIIVPPTLVGSDVQTVVKAVREDTSGRLILALLARLKEEDTLEAMRSALPTRIELTRREAGVDVTLRSRQELQGFVVQAFDVTGQRRDVDADTRERFAKALLASVRNEGGEYRYAARYELRGGDACFRIIVEDVAGQRASASIKGLGR